MRRCLAILLLASCAPSSAPPPRSAEPPAPVAARSAPVEDAERAESAEPAEADTPTDTHGPIGVDALADAIEGAEAAPDEPAAAHGGPPPEDLYRGRLFSFFRRGWAIPPSVDRAEIENAAATVEVTLDDDLAITAFRAMRLSGHAAFDASVLEHFARLRDGGERAPSPPTSIEDQYRGQTIVIRLHGRGAP